MNIDAALLILRLVVGLVFAGHGAQKLFGWFGGKGPAAHARSMDQLGMHPAWFWALTNGLGEFLGGLGLAAGLLTPLAAVALIGSMLVAIAKVHRARGFWNAGGGMEYPLVLAASALALGLAGPGSMSLDTAFGLSLPEPFTYLVALLLMLVVVGAALAAPHRRRPSSDRSQHAAAR